MQIAREERGFPDVFDPGQARHHPLQPDGKAAMWWHPVLERFQIAGKRSGIHPAFSQRRQIRLIAVQTLSSSDQLEAPEEEVEPA